MRPSPLLYAFVFIALIGSGGCKQRGDHVPQSHAPSAPTNVDTQTATPPIRGSRPPQAQRAPSAAPKNAAKPATVAPFKAPKNAAKPATVAPSKAPKTSKRPPAPPGPAYFAVQGRGVVRFDGRVFQRLDNLPTTVDALTVGPKGKLFVAAISGVFTVDDVTVTKIGDYRTTGGARHIDVGRDGTVWVSNGQGVASHRGGRWTRERVPGGGALKGIAVDAAGRLWALESARLHRRGPGGAWSTLPSVTTLRAGLSIAWHSAERGWIGHSGGLLEVDGTGNLRPLMLTGRTRGVSGIATVADGLMAARMRDRVLIWSPLDGPRVLSADSDAFSASEVDAVTVDAQARVWAATDNGVVVIDGTDVHQWVAGAWPDVSGRVRALSVVGAGPTLPPQTAAQTAPVVGRLKRDDKPAEGVRIMMCARPKLAPRGTPCARAPWTASAVTTRGGRFRFDTVPLNTYRLVMGKRVVGRTKITLTRPGATYDVGTVTVSR